jgi:hypothetical protein
VFIMERENYFTFYNHPIMVQGEREQPVVGALSPGEAVSPPEKVTRVWFLLLQPAGCS